VVTIEYFVGKGGLNLAINIIKIKNLINNNDLYACQPVLPFPLVLHMPCLQITGLSDNTLIKAIETF